MNLQAGLAPSKDFLVGGFSDLLALTSSTLEAVHAIEMHRFKYRYRYRYRCRYRLQIEIIDLGNSMYIIIYIYIYLCAYLSMYITKYVNM